MVYSCPSIQHCIENSLRLVRKIILIKIKNKNKNIEREGDHPDWKTSKAISIFR